MALKYITLSGGLRDFSASTDQYVIQGSNNADFVLLSAQDDTIYGRNGDDLIDAIAGGNNTIYAGHGDDTMGAGSGRNAFSGGNGRDLVTYEATFGNVVADLLTGGASGWATGDTYDSIENLTGGQGNDTLRGTNGDNIISGHYGNDIANGRSGIDTYLVQTTTTGWLVVLGNEASTYAATYGVSFGTPGSGKGLALNINGATLMETDRLSNFENLSGSELDDILIGDGADNRLDGNGGDDILDGNGGVDTAYFADLAGTMSVDLRSGTGTIIDFSSSDISTVTLEDIENVITGADRDILIGNAQSNMLAGRASSDLLQGKDGNDWLWGGTDSSRDTLMGGKGKDFLEGGGGADVMDGGNGFDTAAYVRSPAAVQIDLLRKAATGGNATGDEILNIERILGSFHDDFLRGDNDANTLVGNWGDDEIRGCKGDDVIFGGTGGLSITDPNGRNVALDQFGLPCGCDDLSSDIIFAHLPTGTTDNDYIRAGSGNDEVHGEIGNDLIFGDDGNDFLSGGANTDLLIGGRGNDTLSGGASFDFLFGGPGIDTADYSSSTAGVNVDLTAFWKNSGGDASANTIEDIIQAVSNSSINVSETWLAFVAAGAFSDIENGGVDLTLSLPDILVSIENVTGSTFADNLIGNNRSNLLVGRGGDDTLTGGEGDDTLKGGVGADILRGGSGNDTASYEGSGSAVTVNLSANTATGGHATGDSLFNIEDLVGSSFGDKLIGDGKNNELKGQSGSDRLFGFDGKDSLLGGNGIDNLFGGNGDDTLKGGGGNDLLRGDNGADNLTGGGGNDRFIFKDLSDSGPAVSLRDTISDFSPGNDKIDVSGIDAITGGADDSFTFLGSGAFTGAAGELRAVSVGANTRVLMDVNGDGVSDATIDLTGTLALTAGDFIL